MLKLPIWQQVQHKLDIEHRSSDFAKLHNTNITYKQKPIPIYIDDNIALFSFKHQQSDLIKEIEQNEFCFSVIITRNQSYQQMPISFPVYSCIYNGYHTYYLFSDNLSARYEIFTFNFMKWELKPLESLKIKPVRRIKPIITYNEQLQQITISSIAGVHEWQLASPIWKFNINKEQWSEIQVCNQELEIGWIFRILDNIYILKAEVLKIITATQETTIELQGLIIDPKHEFMQYVWDPSQQAYYILIVKLKESQQTPILLRLTKNSIVRLDLGIVLPIEEESRRDKIKTKNPINLKRNGEPAYPFINQSTFMQIRTSNNHKHMVFHTCIENPNAPTYEIKVLQYSIQIHKLQILATLRTPNIKLSSYFDQKKYRDYADLILLTEKKEVFCSKQLFEHYSPKFKKLYSNTTNSRNLGDGPINVRLDHAKLHTVYFLVQQLYHQFSLPLTDLDQGTLLDLMILSQKFQIYRLQSLCEFHIEPAIDNFPKLYDYIRNCETSEFKETVIRFFVIHSQQIIKTMPIGKVQQLIRLIYTPECQHNNWTQLGFKIDNKYTIKSSQNNKVNQHPRNINYLPIVRNQQVHIHLCDKCHKVLDYGEQHRKNKSINRSNMSVISGNHKKDNNSN